MGTPFVTVENYHKFLDSPHKRARKAAQRCQQEYWRLHPGLPGYPASCEEEENWDEVRWAKIRKAIPELAREVYEKARKVWSFRTYGWGYLILELENDDPEFEKTRQRLAVELYLGLETDQMRINEIIAWIKTADCKLTLDSWIHELKTVVAKLPPVPEEAPSADLIIRVFNTLDKTL